MSSIASWRRDLGLGLRFACTGRSGWTRTVLTAVGVGLGVVVLLLAASVPHLMDARDAREAAREPVQVVGEDPGPGMLRMSEAVTEYHGADIRGRQLQPVAGPDAAVPLPPGLDALPGPGEMVVSPALDRLLDSPEGALLAERLDARRVGTIGEEGLVGSGEFFYYEGSDQLGEDNRLISGFGTSTEHGAPMEAALVLLVLVMCVVLLMPVAVFIATAVRFGGERRDQRLAALRLVGADVSMARRIAAGEALAGSLLGLLFGAAGFLALRQYLGRITVWGVSTFPGDIVPSVPLLVLILIAVPASAVSVTLFALRGVAIEPLGVARQTKTRQRRLTWRLIPAVVGLLLLAPLTRSFHDADNGTLVLAGVGIVLLLTGATVVLPWLVEWAVGAVRGGPVSWQLATRRLQLSSGPASRAVSGITVAVAGATALYMLFAGVNSEETWETGQDPRRAQIEVNAYDLSGPDAQRLFGEVNAQQGVRDTYAMVSGYAAPAGMPPDHGDEAAMEALAEASVEIVVADCPTLRELADIDACADGEVFLARPGDWTSEVQPRPGDRWNLALDFTSATETEPPGEDLWTVPASARTVTAHPDPTGMRYEGILATPGALDVSRFPAPSARALLRIESGDPDAIERVRNVVWDSPAHDSASVWKLDERGSSDEIRQIKRALLIGATGVMLLIGASMIVTTLEQLRERKRLLSVLVAFGTRRATLGVSVLWQTAVPVVLGLAVASVVGTGLGALLMAMVDLPVGNWLACWPMVAVGGGMIALVTLVSMPPLWYLMRPDGLRTE